jgi:hypothetical protein
MIKTIRKLKEIILRKDANAALISAIGIVSATMAIYFFISVRNLSIERQQKITHLNNAVEMAKSVQFHIDGKSLGIERLGRYTRTQLHTELGSRYYDGASVELEDLVDDGLILDANDPTKTLADGAKTDYDLEDSKVTITYYDASGAAITAGGTTVASVKLEVTLKSKSGHTYITHSDILNPGAPPIWETDVFLP